MVQDLERRFTTSTTTVVALAESCRFDRCVRREPLEKLLREADQGV